MTVKRYKATVTCMMTIHTEGVWGAECTMAQIEKQAKDSARGLLQKLKDPRALAISDSEKMSFEKCMLIRAVKSIQPVQLVKVEVLPE